MALHRMGWHYVLHTFCLFLAAQNGQVLFSFCFSTPDIVSIVGIAIPFDFWSPGHLKVGITFHGHHNYSPDWSTKKGNPELCSIYG